MTMEDAIQDQDATRVDRDLDATVIGKPLRGEKSVDSASAEFIPPNYFTSHSHKA